MELRKTNWKCYQSCIDAINEYRVHNVNTYEFLDVNQDDIFRKIENLSLENNLPEGLCESDLIILSRNYYNG